MNVDILILLDDWATIKQNQALTHAGWPEADAYLSEVKRYRMALEEIKSLRAELKLYKPCQRSNTPPVPVKAVGECNDPYWFNGINETDEEFAERSGRKVEAGHE